MEALPQKNIENSESYEKVKGIIENIDFNVLHDICKILLEKTGANEDRLEKVAEEIIAITNEKSFIVKIYNKYLNPNTAVYNHQEDKIVINSEKISTFEEDDIRVIIFHELIHSISDMVKVEHSYTHVEGRVGLSAYSLEVKKGIFIKRIYRNHLLNEGVTELIAEAVEDEYATRTGQITESTPNYKKAYPLAKKVVSILVTAISHKTEVPVDVVFKSLVRSVFNYDYDEFFELVKSDPELFDLIEKIENLSFETDLLKFEPLKLKFSVDLKKLALPGLETLENKVLEDNYEFNPLQGTLK